MSSRFTPCPVCGRSVALALINTHLDSDCQTKVEVECRESKRDRDPVVVDPDQPVQSVPSPSSTTTPNAKRPRVAAPLADRVRPKSLLGFVGQTHKLGPLHLLQSVLSSSDSGGGGGNDSDRVHLPSLILWGPPGTGKTTLAHVLAHSLSASHLFVSLSAVSCGLADVRRVIEEAKKNRQYGKKTILFVDEIHRFNKLQQDAFLPHVEDGTLVLVGATTENPSFEINNALLSRCRVFTLEKLSTEDIVSILTRAVNSLISDLGPLDVEPEAVQLLAQLADGDARVALNNLETVTMHVRKVGGSVSRSVVTQCLGRKAISYDKDGEEHYNLISALHKSIRGSDLNASLYWLGRMLKGGEQPLFIARRLIRCASEDIGLADPFALTHSVAVFQACHMLGMPECDVILAQAVAYLAQAPKSIAVYSALNRVYESIKEDPHAPVPLHLRNASTQLLSQVGYGEGYKYNPHFQEPVIQDYLPSSIQHRRFWEAPVERQHTKFKSPITSDSQE